MSLTYICPQCAEAHGIDTEGGLEEDGTCDVCMIIGPTLVVSAQKKEGRHG